VHEVVIVVGDARGFAHVAEFSFGGKDHRCWSPEGAFERA
jgi:hypothetical protein